MENVENKVAIAVVLRVFQKPTQKLVIEDFSTEKTIEELKNFIKIKLGNNENLSLIFRGNLLENNKTLHGSGIEKCCEIQAVAKKLQKKEELQKNEQFSESLVQEITSKFKQVSNSNFHKASRAEFLEKILQTHPNLRSNLTAIAYLKDPILISTLANAQTVRKLAEEHRDLLNASKTICDALNSKSTVAAPADDLQDSDSDSNELLPSTSSSRAGRNIRRITSNQLAQALGSALSSSNSLASISQRNLNNNQSLTDTPPNSANHVTNSMFMNAISEVLRSTRSNNETRSETAAAPPPELPNRQIQFANQLESMREMGLQDTATNLQALVITNGDLEAAVNLVLTNSMSN